MLPFIDVVTIIAVLLASIVLPISACLMTRKMTGASVTSLLVGMAVFFVCYIIALATQTLFALVMDGRTLLTFALALRGRHRGIRALSCLGDVD
ncbi:MAG: hypothetical protein LBE85_04120 [Candidatus Accumulibacter sp.]|jgi:uncharacterized membrane protein YhfC|nr:hypothetical protein [Accumulibacter sp.]